MAAQLAILGEALAVGVSAERMRIYIQHLADIPREQLALAFQRALREMKFFPTIAELRQLAGESVKETADAEARRAWDEVTQFASKWVQSDVHGGYGISQGCRSTPPPELPQRILDCVRRTGGWQAYKCMTVADYPFQQKRFMEEYQAYQQVERTALPAGLADSMRLLVERKGMVQ